MNNQMELDPENKNAKRQHEVLEQRVDQQEEIYGIGTHEGEHTSITYLKGPKQKSWHDYIKTFTENLASKLIAKANGYPDQEGSEYPTFDSLAEEIIRILKEEHKYEEAIFDHLIVSNQELKYGKKSIDVRCYEGPIKRPLSSIQDDVERLNASEGIYAISASCCGGYSLIKGRKIDKWEDYLGAIPIINNCKEFDDFMHGKFLSRGYRIAHNFEIFRFDTMFSMLTSGEIMEHCQWIGISHETAMKYINFHNSRRDKSWDKW